MLRRLLTTNIRFVNEVKPFQCERTKQFPTQFLFRSFSSIKMANIKEMTIGTHNGIFHCDEILAIYMLQQLPKYSNSKVIRTRDNAVLDKCDIVVDVGSIFDPEKNRFDHHQITFKHSLGSLRSEFGDKWSAVRLSSAGLIYTYFGEDVIREIVKREKNIDIDKNAIPKVFEKVYEYFIQEIDGIDNGVPQFPCEPLYRISSDISSRVGTFNSQWNSPADFDEMTQFNKAKELVGAELTDKILYYATVWWPARAIVEKAIIHRNDIHPSGEIIEINQMCPWKQHLFDLEKEHNIEGKIKYCIGQAGKSDVRVICVPVTANSFVCRKFLPEAWRGIRDEEFKNVCHNPEANFCHATGFICGCTTRNAAIDLATKSLEFEMDENDNKKPRLSKNDD